MQEKIMERIKNLVRKFLREEDGAAIAEYGLLLAIVAVGFITVLTAFRDDLRNWWNNLKNNLTNTPSP
jgi:pilus assembly protein Flp/PilA